MNDVSVMTEHADEPAAESPDGRFSAAHRAELNHKIRTPLNAIIGFAELLLLQPGSKRKDGDVQQILKSAHELLEIVEVELGEAGENGASRSGAPEKHVCDVLYVEDDAVNFTLVERILE